MFTRKFKAVLFSLGPGIFLMGYNIGTGSVTTMAASGSRYGMTLFWALLLSCLFTFTMLVAYGRYSLVSGRTALCSFREHFGGGVSIFIMIGLIIGEVAALMGIMGIVVNMVDEWVSYMTGRHVSTILVTLIIVAVLYYLFWTGGYQKFEKLLMAFVGIMGGCFIISMFLVIPEPTAVARGLMPGIPDEPNAHLIAAGMAGTTLSAVVFVMRSIVVQEKGWAATNLREERRDAVVSASLMLLLSGAVMAAAAGTLYRQGIPVDRAVDMVRTLEPMAGPFAITLFVVGILSAGLSTVFPIVLIAPWLISDFTNQPRDIKSPLYRILAAAGMLMTFTVPVFGGRPVFLMIASQAFQALLMPMIALGIMYLLNKGGLMGQHRAGWLMNLGCGATFAFSLLMAYSGLLGLTEMFKSHF